MTSGDAVALLTERFVQRTTAYGRQWYNPDREDGGYLKVMDGVCPPGSTCPRSGCEHKTAAPLTADILARHLDGTTTIGVYQLSDDDHLRWICFDVDKDKSATPLLDQDADAREQTRLVVRACQSLGLHPLVEDSGNRGYHVWLFTDGPVPAQQAQAVGRHVLSMVPATPGIRIELFPKQVTVKSLGNLVKLPLGIHQKSGRRCLFVNRRFVPLEDQLAALRTVPLVSLAQMDALIASHGLEVKPVRLTLSSTGGVSSYRPVCLVTMLDHGVTDGARDVGTFKIACYLRDKGIPHDLAESMLMQWNDIRNAPPLPAHVVQIKVDSAYSGGYSWMPCADSSFDAYCSTSCTYWEKKLRQRHDLRKQRL